MTLVSEPCAAPPTMEESPTHHVQTPTHVQTPQTQEKHRKQQCQGCAELKKARREVKRLKQEVRAARQVSYSEQQRAARLQEQLDTQTAEMSDLRGRLEERRGTEGCKEGWLDVCADFRRRTRRRPGKSRGITWHRRYLMVQDGRLRVCRGPGQQGGQDGTDGEGTVDVDISDDVMVTCPGPHDPEVFLLNRDHQKVIKIMYHPGHQSESSSASDCSESATTDTSARRVLVLEVPSVEEKMKWLAVLTDQKGPATSVVDHPPPTPNGEPLNGHHGDGSHVTGSLSEADVSASYWAQRELVLRGVRTRHDSDGSIMSSTTSSHLNLADLEVTSRSSASDSEDAESRADDIWQNGCDVTPHSEPTNQDQAYRLRRLSEGDIPVTTINSLLGVSELPLSLSKVDKTKMAVLMLSVIVATAALVLMTESL